MVIDRFTGPHGFLSNFYPSALTIGGHVYPTVEHAYQAAKTTDEDERELIRQAPSPGAAKRLGQRVSLRPGWETLRLTVMERLLWIKFTPRSMMLRLRATGTALLVEGNTWGDRFWGVCDGQGENHLGRLLMVVRTPTRVVNLRDEPFDIYIGRAGKGQDGQYGNPFRLPPGEPRGATLALWRDHFYARVARDQDYRRSLMRLRGKRLGCFCAPLACHGDTYVEFHESAYR